MSTVICGRFEFEYEYRCAEYEYDKSGIVALERLPVCTALCTVHSRALTSGLLR